MSIPTSWYARQGPSTRPSFGRLRALASLLVPALVAYLGLLLVVSLLANRRVQNEEDYIVAGRRLPLSLATATLFATWFGAGTVLTASDEKGDSG